MLAERVKQGACIVASQASSQLKKDFTEEVTEPAVEWLETNQEPRPSTLKTQSMVVRSAMLAKRVKQGACIVASQASRQLKKDFTEEVTEPAVEWLETIQAHRPSTLKMSIFLKDER